MRVVLYNPGTEGGIVKYGWCQAAALHGLGAEVTVLASHDSNVPAPDGVRALRALSKGGAGRKASSKVRRMAGLAGGILWNELRLLWEVVRLRPHAVLLASYSEYLSPLWAWWHALIGRLSGATYVAVLHDPVRDFVVGPAWWHALSVRLAYWPLSAVFIHQKLPVKAWIPRRVVVREVPHGLYETPATPGRSAVDVRREWGIPPEAVALLSFGFIRDGKNLDLIIRALRDNPAVHLVVMGRVQSTAVCRPVSFYLDLAAREEVLERVRFIEGFVPDSALASCLEAADVIAMTYSTSFHSQSGVLNTVAAAAKPVLASSGDSPLKDCVQRFQLGVFVEPDNAKALSTGLRELCGIVAARREGQPLPPGAPALDWVGYRRYASWETNARVILDTVAEVRGGIQECLAQRR